MPLELLTTVFVPIIVALVSSMGLWRFLQFRAEQEYQRRTNFHQTLQSQIDCLSEQVQDLHSQKTDLLREIAELREALAESKATIMHLEDLLRRRTYET